MIDILFIIALKLYMLLLSGMIFFFVGYTIWAIYYDSKDAYIKYIRKKIYEHELETNLSAFNQAVSTKSKK